MGRQLKQLDPARSDAHRLGVELRRWRLLVGISQEALGVATCHSGALVSKIERGERAASLDFCRAMDTELRTGGALERLWTAAVVNPGETTGPTPLSLGCDARWGLWVSAQTARRQGRST